MELSVWIPQVSLVLAVRLIDLMPCAAKQSPPHCKPAAGGASILRLDRRLHPWCVYSWTHVHAHVLVLEKIGLARGVLMQICCRKGSLGTFQQMWISKKVPVVSALCTGACIDQGLGGVTGVRGKRVFHRQHKVPVGHTRCTQQVLLRGLPPASLQGDECMSAASPAAHAICAHTPRMSSRPPMRSSGGGSAHIQPHM